MLPIIRHRIRSIFDRRAKGVYFHWFTPVSKAELEKIVNKKVDDSVTF